MAFPMKTALRVLAPAVALVLAAGACNGQTPAARSTQSDFARLVQQLSEPDGYFDTDNLISNETSYLHVMGKMREMGVTGGAYLGVGPSQNFSYIAQIRPRIAFIVDIRRDNLLHHLLYKALFELSGNRVEYLAMFFGRPIPDDATQWSGRSIQDLVAYFDGQPARPDLVDEYRKRIDERVLGFGLELSDADRATIRRFHDTFIRAGLGLRFNSFGRAPQPYYPTFRQLLLERDLTGKQVNYLAREADFQAVKSMQHANRVIPVVGNLAGRHAVGAIGDYLSEIGQQVSAFYTSNVEFYVMGDGAFRQFADNLVGLPRSEQGVIIRSVFGGMFRMRHPQAVPGYYSTQVLQTMESFAREHESNGFLSYQDLVTKHSLDLR
jgi:hypothetical protein